MRTRHLTVDLPLIEVEFDHRDGLLDDLGSVVGIDLLDGFVPAVTLVLHSQARVRLVADGATWTAHLLDDHGRMLGMLELTHLAGFADDVTRAQTLFDELWEVTTSFLAQITTAVMTPIKRRVASDINCVTSSVPF